MGALLDGAYSVRSRVEVNDEFESTVARSVRIDRLFLCSTPGVFKPAWLVFRRDCGINW